MANVEKYLQSEMEHYQTLIAKWATALIDLGDLSLRLNALGEMWLEDYNQFVANEFGEQEYPIQFQMFDLAKKFAQSKQMEFEY